MRSPDPSFLKTGRYSSPNNRSGWFIWATLLCFVLGQSALVKRLISGIQISSDIIELGIRDLPVKV